MVITYAESNGTKWYYREKVPNQDKYRNKLIPDATTLEQAVEGAMDAMIALKEDDPHHLSELVTRTRPNNDALSLLEREEKLQRRKERLARAARVKNNNRVSILTAIKDWINVQKKRVDAGNLEQTSFTHKDIILRIHLYKYLTEYKRLTNTSQINNTTFDEYLIFRADTTRINQQRELTVVGEFIKKHLIKHALISEQNWVKSNFLPTVDVRQIDRMANPAINEKDWRTIHNFVRNQFTKEANNLTQPIRRLQRQYFVKLFYTFIMIAKNTGMSPEEILKLKYKNVEVRNVGRISKSKKKEELADIFNQEEDRKYFAKLHEMAAEGNFKDLDKLKEVDLPDEITADDVEVEIENPDEWVSDMETTGRVDRFVTYFTTIRSKTKEPREIPCNIGDLIRQWREFQISFLTEKANGLEQKIDLNTFIFCNPWKSFEPWNQYTIGMNWREKIYKKLKEEGKLVGHKFSEKPYTLYSMRSTFIEDHLIKGTDIFLLARIAGHDVKTLMQSYERMDIRRRAQEITSINWGAKKDDFKVEKVVD